MIDIFTGKWLLDRAKLTAVRIQDTIPIMLGQDFVKVSKCQGKGRSVLGESKASLKESRKRTEVRVWSLRFQTDGLESQGN